MNKILSENMKSVENEIVELVNNSRLTDVFEMWGLREVEGEEGTELEMVLLCKDKSKQNHDQPFTAKLRLAEIKGKKQTALVFFNRFQGFDFNAMGVTTVSDLQELEGLFHELLEWGEAFLHVCQKTITGGKDASAMKAKVAKASKEMEMGGELSQTGKSEEEPV